MWPWWTKLLIWTGVLWPKGVPTLWYNGWSGFLSCLGLVGATLALVFHAVITYRHRNCHVRRCPRIGHLVVEGTPWVVCRRHHPDGAPTRAEVIAAHSTAKAGKAQQ